MTRTTCPDNPGRIVRRRSDGQQPPFRGCPSGVRASGGQRRLLANNEQERDHQEEEGDTRNALPNRVDVPFDPFVHGWRFDFDEFAVGSFNKLRVRHG